MIVGIFMALRSKGFHPLISRIIPYEWDISKSDQDSVSAEMTFLNPDYRITISGNGAMKSFEGPEAQTAWQSFQNMTTGWQFRLREVMIQEGVTNVGAYTFVNHSSLEQVTLPSSLKQIDHSAFLNCSSLKSITFLGTKAQWEAVALGKNWSAGTAISQIFCSDGVVDDLPQT